MNGSIEDGPNYGAFTYCRPREIVGMAGPPGSTLTQCPYCLFGCWKLPIEPEELPPGSTAACTGCAIKRATDQKAMDAARYEREKMRKPPVGLYPRKLWNEGNPNPTATVQLLRFLQVMAAIRRYRSAGFTTPIEWFAEVSETLPGILAHVFGSACHSCGTPVPSTWWETINAWDKWEKHQFDCKHMIGWTCPPCQNRGAELLTCLICGGIVSKPC